MSGPPAPTGPASLASARLGEIFSRLHARELPLVVRACRLQRHRPLARIMLAATRGGDGWALVALVPAALLLEPARAQVALAAGLLSGLATAVVVQGLKSLVRRRRPVGDGVLPPIGAPDRWAFPSGHTAHSVSVLVIAWWLHPLLGLALLPFSLAVGASRVFFGLHYPSDVAVGASIGATIAAGTLGAAQASGLAIWILRMGPLA